MAAGRCRAAQWICRNSGPVGDELHPDWAGDRFAVFARHRQVEQHASVAGQQIALPGGAHHGVSAPEEEPVARIFQRNGIVGRRGIVEELHRPQVASVAVIEEDAFVPARRIGRLQDDHVGNELNQTLGVGRCLIQVDDARLRRVRGIDCEMSAAGQALIGAGSAEFISVGERFALCNSQFDLIAHLVSSRIKSTGIGSPYRISLDLFRRRGHTGPRVIRTVVSRARGDGDARCDRTRILAGIGTQTGTNR